jgi:hypothetical protein
MIYAASCSSNALLPHTETGLAVIINASRRRQLHQHARASRHLSTRTSLAILINEPSLVVVNFSVHLNCQRGAIMRRRRQPYDIEQSDLDRRGLALQRGQLATGRHLHVLLWCACGFHSSWPAWPHTHPLIRFLLSRRFSKREMNYKPRFALTPGRP